MRTHLYALVLGSCLFALIGEPVSAQPRTRLLIAVPQPDGPQPAVIDISGPLRQALLKVGFLFDGQPFRTCEATPRIVVRGSVDGGRMEQLRGFSDTFPGVRLYDNPMVKPLYEDLCINPWDHGESQARDAAGLTTNGLTHGKGSIVAIVDLGVDIGAIAARFPRVKRNATFSWPATQGAIGGDHGTLCGYVAAMAAPAIEIADVRVEGDAGSFAQAYTFLQQTWRNDGAKWKSLVVSTSWEFPKEGVAAVGAFRPNESLASEPSHPLRASLQCLADSGIDVVFAAGNSGICAPGEARLPETIRPPNSLSIVSTIAAVDAKKTRLSDSGQGGLGAADKPDFSAFGSFILANGTEARHTSMATAFAAGMIASLRSLDGWSWDVRPTRLVRECFARHADKHVQVPEQHGGTTLSQITGHSVDFGRGVLRFDADVLKWKDECGALREAAPPTASRAP